MSKRVLVVDDSRFVYEQMKRMLEASDFSVVGHCTTGEDVLDTYAELLPDIVTMDIILPGMDGLEASDLLLQSYPDAHILIISSLAYDETEEKAKELGIDSFLFKPFDEESLLESLCQATGG